jgi:hypothetical protein
MDWNQVRLRELHRLTNKYPDVDVRKMGWVKKYVPVGMPDDWYWVLTPKGRKALYKR